MKSSNILENLNSENCQTVLSFEKATAGGREGYVGTAVFQVEGQISIIAF